MGRRRPSKRNRKKARTDAGRGDRLTALPLELRARIASLLHFRQIVQLSVLSRPWRHIHHHAPVVKLHLHNFPGEEDSILAARVALARRAHDTSASTVETLRLAFAADDSRMQRHAGRIVALTNAREIRIRKCVYAPYHRHDGAAALEAWALDLPPAARELEVVASDHLAPVVGGGPGAAALSKLTLGVVVIREWPPSLPSLRSLDLDAVTVEAAFAPGTWCPRLEELDVFNSKIEHARVDIRLPLLRFLGLDEVDVSPHGKHGRGDTPPFGVIAIDAPKLLELEVNCSSGSSHADYRSFTLQAPRLRLFVWVNQFAERVSIDVGRPGSVKFGTIQLSSIFCRKLERYREQMMRVLEGLLPDLPRESVAGVARPYMTLEECDDSDDDEDETKEEKLTCDIDALMRAI